jgi:class 3 adenylate cyclase/tetratricopeptide (TPR) repeat protein
VCTKCGQENPEGFLLCGMCGTPLAASDGPGREVRKTVTVVFCDIVDSTGIADGADPEVVHDLMSAYFDRVREVLERHGGTVEKFIGDAAMAVFGVPVVHEDDALRAVRAAAEIHAVLDALAIPVRIGVNTGEVVAHPGDTLVTGDAVNVAARLEQNAAPGDILIGDSTHQLVRAAIVADATEPVAVKGKAGPVLAWRLVAVSQTGGAVVRRFDTPLIGREHELGMLRGALARSDRERRCHLFTLLGAPGVGKSRLVAELAAGAGPARVLVGHCLSYGEGITYWPLAEILRAAAGMDDADDRGRARALLGELVAGEPEAEEIAERLASVAGLGGSAAASAEISWAIRRTFERLGRDAPVIVVFEDLHWAEPALLDLIDHLAGWCRASAILLVCTARPELIDRRPSWAGGRADATSILLAPLRDEECDRLISALASGEALPAERRARLIDAAGGNPLFVEQMLAMIGRGGDPVEVPATISALLAARLDQLGGGERLVVECAAVEGRVFHRSAVEALAPQADRAATGGHLQLLVRRELIEPQAAQLHGQEAYRFQHALIREAAYDAIPKRVRSALHERFAAWLEAVAGDRFEEYEEIVAHHLTEAVRYRRELMPGDPDVAPLAERAADRIRRAADRAAVRSDYVAAATMLARVAALLPAGDRRVALALVDRAHWLRWAEPEQAAAAAGAAVRAAHASGVATERLIEICARFVRLEIDGGIDVPGLVDDARAEAERLDAADPPAAARLWWIVATLAATHLHRSSVAVVAAARACELAAAVGAEWLRTDATGLLIQATMSGPGEISVLLEEGARLAAGAAVLRRAMYLDSRALVLAQQGELDAALAAIDEAAGIWTELGLTTWLDYGPAWLRGSVLLLAGRPDAAIPQLRAALAGGADASAATIHALLARALALTGAGEDALAEAERARALVRPGDVPSEMLWRGASIRALSALGRPAAAARPARELLALAGEIDIQELRFGALTDVADAERVAGHPASARALLEEALTESEARGAESFATQARRALTALAAS